MNNVSGKCTGQIIKELGLSKTKLAEIFRVNIRTVSRWLKNDSMTGPARNALLSWHKLKTVAGIATPWLDADDKDFLVSDITKYNNCKSWASQIV